MRKSVIAIDKLNKTYITDRGNNVEALQDIVLDVYNNDFVCIVGPSGCGKSTLLRIIAGLDEATSGFVYYHEKQVNKPNKEIGMVFQEYSLLPWRTVMDNITLGLEFSGKSRQQCHRLAKEYLSLVGLDAFANAYPYELSGGMQQRVAIARALANNPHVLLMDEPFGALDAHTRIIMQRELLSIWEKNRKTILFVTHSVDEAIYLSDYIVVMSANPGKIKEIIKVNMPRPRDRANPFYGQLSAKILDMLEEESEIAKAVVCG